jgi:hypothetical protein
MMGTIRFTVWVHRRGGSIFGDSSRPVNREGLILTFSDERRARAECDRLIASSGDPYARYTVEKDMAPPPARYAPRSGAWLAELTFA